MIPRTILPKELGGDGDPLDVIVLGPAVPRGSVVRAKLIGVLKLLDGGEQDDKLIAVLENTPMYEINSIQEMNSKFIGVSKIIETWFVNYKGPGELSSKGFAERNEAQKILEYAIKSYENKN
jgi:inorganic pyrophosphatase